MSRQFAGILDPVLPHDLTITLTKDNYGHPRLVLGLFGESVQNESENIYRRQAKAEATSSLRVRKIFGSIPVLQLILFAGLDFVASYEAMLQQ